MARWSTFKKESGRTCFTVSGKDLLGIKRQIPAFPSERLSRELADNISELIGHRQRGIPLPSRLKEYFRDLPKAQRNRLAGYELLTSDTHPLSAHVVAFAIDLKKTAKGKTASDKSTRVRRVIEATGAETWTDLSTRAIQEALDTMQTGKHQGSPISDTTYRHYVQTIKQFGKWMVRTGRTDHSHIESLEPRKIKVTRERRALSVEEWQWLESHLDAASDFAGIKANERRLLYATAIQTGLRANELRSLAVNGLNLDKSPAWVFVDGKNTKNGKPARQENSRIWPTNSGST